MDCELTPSEIALADRLISNMERKQYRGWAWVRWVVLLTCVAYLSVGLLCLHLVSRSRESFTPVEILALPATRNDILLELRGAEVMWRVSAMGLFACALSIVLCLFVLTHWNRHLRDRLIAKLLRAAFNEKYGGTAHPPRTDTA